MSTSSHFVVVLIASFAAGGCSESPPAEEPGTGGVDGISTGMGGPATGEGKASGSGNGEADADPTNSGGGPRLDVGVDDSGTTGGAGTTCAGNQILEAVVRDFTTAHPDFEAVLGVDPGIVETQLGADGKPVYAGMPETPTTSGQAAFDQWYRDVPGVNTPIPLSIELEEVSEGMFTFSDSDFFPIDGQGSGNEGNPHNYHFTLELHTEFVYEGGEIFSFTGDDDLFVFINGVLAIDLGGVHGPMSATADLDAAAAELGIQPGNTYTLDFFFAERHTTQSNFRIDTTIGCLESIPPG